MQRSSRNGGNIYDLRRDLPRPPADARKEQSAGSADGRYGFNGEPLSFAPDRTANGTVRRTRTDNSIEFPSQSRPAQSNPQRARSQSQRPRPAQNARPAQPGRQAAGQRQPANRRKVKKGKKKPGTAAQQRYQNQRLRPAQQPVRDPVRREKKKKRKVTRATMKRRRMMRRLMAFVTLLAVIAAGVYLTMTMLFKIGTIQVQTADGTVVQEAAGYSSDQILQALGVQTEENIFSFSPAEKEKTLEKQFPLLESIRVVRDYPNTVVVQVTEAVPAYAMQTKSGWLTLSDQFKILACESAQPDGLKTLYGGEPVSAAPGDQLAFAAVPDADAASSEAASGSAASAVSDAAETDARLDALNELQAKLGEYGMLEDVTRIEFADTDQMAFLYQDRVSVLLGTLNDLDYKLDRARYVLTDADGKGCAPTDTGRLDFSHVSAGGTRKIYFAQGTPTLPSGYIVPEKTEQEPAADPSAEDAAGDETTDGQAAAAEDATAQTDGQAEDPSLTDPARMTANEEQNPM